MKLQPFSATINSIMPPNVSFKPNSTFYSSIGVNKHRFAKIMRGEVEPKRIELFEISEYFKIPITAFFISTQEKNN